MDTSPWRGGGSEPIYLISDKLGKIYLIKRNLGRIHQFSGQFVCNYTAWEPHQNSKLWPRKWKKFACGGLSIKSLSKLIRWSNVMTLLRAAFAVGNHNYQSTLDFLKIKCGFLVLLPISKLLRSAQSRKQRRRSKARSYKKRRFWVDLHVMIELWF